MFLVTRGYSETGNTPTFRPSANPYIHKSLEEAQNEAERLARETGGKFYVFMALSVSEAQAAPVKTTFL